MGPAIFSTRAHRLAAKCGHKVMRPLEGARCGSFALTYVRTGPESATPFVVIPGGPGLASVVPYRPFRAAATRYRLDIIMVEHRGLGLSRSLPDGTPLPQSAVTVADAADDIAAVLDDAGVHRAFIVGSSYGSYVAQAFAVRHPARVAALIVDSPMLSVETDLAVTRAYRRRLFWNMDRASINPIALMVRHLAAAGEPLEKMGHVIQTTYEYAGLEVLARLLQARLRGRLGWLWDKIAHTAVSEFNGKDIPYFMEAEPMANIAYGELGFGLPPDGSPLDPQLTVHAVRGKIPEYRGEPFDFASALPNVDFPVIAVSGDRDLQTPRLIARRIVDLAPHSVLVPLRRTGHSALDTHQLALLAVMKAVQAGQWKTLRQRAALMSHLPRKGTSGAVGHLVGILIRAVTLPLDLVSATRRTVLPPA